MSANRIFLVCSHHQNPEDALLLSERGGCDVPYEIAKLKTADKWFLKHEHCGRGKDHYQLAYARPIDYDQALPAEESVHGGVKLAMAVNGAH